MTMATSLDFSSALPPSGADFLSRLALLLAAWILVLSLVERACRSVADAFWSRPVPVDAARIPSKLPHPNPPGGAVPFDVPLKEATEEQIEAFLRFRGKGGSWGGVDEDAMQRVANCAAGYKGALYEERMMKWIDDHFRLHLPNLKFPYVGRHWNGWSSMWIETGPHIRKMFLASLTVIVEHVVNGLVLPGLYLRTRNDVYYNLALYGELAYMVYSSSLIAASYHLGRDVTVEQMHPSVWTLLLVHHAGSVMLCALCVFAGEGVPKDLACYVLLALLGLTSSLHYVGQILDFSPWSQSNAPLTRFWNHVFCLASQLVFRGVYWVNLAYVAVMHCFETHGRGTTVAVSLVFLLFSLFNLDFVKFHAKATKGCWMRIQQEKMYKNCFK